MKKFWTDKLPTSTALIGALLALLILLASLQYYWLGEVSTGERERLQALVRTGAARYFAHGAGAVRPASSATRCPSDAELQLAVSATAQREAETRAEQCFAREVVKVNDWRAVR